MSTPIHLFFSYSSSDESLRLELEAQLANLKRQGRILSFDQRMIGPGEVWSTKLAAGFEQAKVILLLISPDFMASDYCNDVEASAAGPRSEPPGRVSRGDAGAPGEPVRSVESGGSTAVFRAGRALSRSDRRVRRDAQYLSCGRAAGRSRALPRSPEHR